MMKINLQPVLEDQLVILRPLQRGDFEDLFRISHNPLVWQQHPAKERSEIGGFSRFFQDALDSGSAFCILDKKNKNIIGTTRFNPSAEISNAIEIGWTFIAPEFWGGTINKSIKNLMLEHAFTGYEYVLFYIHSENFRSQKAVEKIGARPVKMLENKRLTERFTASMIYMIAKDDFKQG